MPVVRSNDIDIHFETEGDPRQPALMFSNSLGTDWRMWQPQADHLRGRFHVIRYDTRGHGQSGAPSGPYSLAQLGLDALAVLDHLDIERAHFCGISMGGATAQWLGIYAPQRLRKLVIANSAARIGTEAGWRERAALARREGLDGIADGAPARWFTPAFAALEPLTVAALADTLRAGSAQGYAGCCDALAGADLRAQLPLIAAPTLVIAGAADPVTTVVDGQAMRQLIPRAELVTLDASHISNIEAARTFNLTLADFLAD
ncbi:3-oxoadipate enol-lactonase [Rugamonas apoptosis]|uniref:3-oxoadipate enol-lactonase n=1 Tax=Rugamonas apoptosis TaxID=2758570 RepID=A0A7W2FCH5_9BURK|nr:3-oxoadipate enol-lactonase [Rugamonas apoptosis]MBA5689082.1 3-oxoadipate enol-lactonase [Rugamonas apoptosis]